MRTERWQLLYVYRRSLMRRRDRYAYRHIALILILRRWKIIIVERSQFQSILKDSGVVRFLVRLHHNQRQRKCEKQQRKGLCNERVSYEVERYFEVSISRTTLWHKVGVRERVLLARLAEETLIKQS